MGFDTVPGVVLGRQIARAARVLDGPFAEVLEQYDLTRNAWWLLTEIYGDGSGRGMPLGAIAQRSALAASSATVAADLLVRRALIRRSRRAHDRRTVLVAITPAGIALVRQARVELESRVAHITTLFSAEERTLFCDLLARITDLPEDDQVAHPAPR